MCGRPCQGTAIRAAGWDRKSVPRDREEIAMHLAKAKSSGQNAIMKKYGLLFLLCTFCSCGTRVIHNLLFFGNWGKIKRVFVYYWSVVFEKLAP